MMAFDRFCGGGQVGGMKKVWLPAVTLLAGLSVCGSLWVSAAGGKPLEKSNLDMDTFTWKALPEFPDGIGVALPYTGVSNGALIIAGGTHFEGEGEARHKAWTDDIYVFEEGGTAWKTGFTLEKPLTYGACVNIEQGMLCMGGSDPEKVYADVFLLEWVDGKIRQTAWPSLPEPCMYTTAALVGSTVYVAGGQQKVDSAGPTETMKNFWALDLSSEEPAWEVLEPWPGPGRILPVAASQGGSFYLFSGTDLVKMPDGSTGRKYLKDAYRYDPGAGKWTQLGDSPRVMFAAPSPAFALGDTRIAICGGLDGVSTGASEEEKAKSAGLFRDILIYDTTTDGWSMAGAIPSNQIVTNATRWGDSYVIPSGEVGGAGLRNLNVYVGTPQ